jgi:hypothetical protein
MSFPSTLPRNLTVAELLALVIAWLMEALAEWKAAGATTAEVRLSDLAAARSQDVGTDATGGVARDARAASVRRRDDAARPAAVARADVAAVGAGGAVCRKVADGVAKGGVDRARRAVGASPVLWSCGAGIPLAGRCRNFGFGAEGRGLPISLRYRINMALRAARAAGLRERVRRRMVAARCNPPRPGHILTVPTPWTRFAR